MTDSTRLLHEVYFADSRQMTALSANSVDFAVTSPPYWSIKDYGCAGQIGFEQEYGDYIAALTEVFAEVLRVLRPGCRFAVNIGDQYLRAADHGRYRVQPIAADLLVAARHCGYDCMGTIIWRKISTTRTSGGGQWMGSVYFRKDGHITYEHEYVLLLRKLGNWKRPPLDVREKSRLTAEQRSRWFRGVWDDIPPERQKGHAAMFPVALAERLIRMYSFWGETVLDPFLGSGTTILAAHRATRRCVGYEINPEFLPVMRERLAEITTVEYHHSAEKPDNR